MSLNILQCLNPFMYNVQVHSGRRWKGMTLCHRFRGNLPLNPVTFVLIQWTFSKTRVAQNQQKIRFKVQKQRQRYKHFTPKEKFNIFVYNFLRWMHMIPRKLRMHITVPRTSPSPTVPVPGLQSQCNIETNDNFLHTNWMINSLNCTH